MLGMPESAIVAGLFLAAASILGLVVIYISRDGGEPDHEGWEGDHAGELDELVDELNDPDRWETPGAEEPAPADDGQPIGEVLVPVVVAEYHGRHHEDTVQLVAADWRPVIGRRHIAATTDTQQFEAVDA